MGLFLICFPSVSEGCSVNRRIRSENVISDDSIWPERKLYRCHEETFAQIFTADMRDVLHMCGLCILVYIVYVGALPRACLEDVCSERSLVHTFISQRPYEVKTDAYPSQREQAVLHHE
ncbi:hypothetical protein NQZ68_007673 [Dissostichus eleginoides]|nr:hypothetical protein NQZ68_007673 [Dissostichus eleginoides]